MRPASRILRRLGSLRDAGATSAEYALIAGLIAVVIVAAVTYFGASVAASWSDSASQVESAVGGP